MNICGTSILVTALSIVTASDDDSKVDGSALVNTKQLYEANVNLKTFQQSMKQTTQQQDIHKL